MAILILNGYSHEHMPYEKWLKDSSEDLVLVTCRKHMNEFPADKYIEIIGFNNYEINSNVELTAIELNKKYNFTRIISTYEFDLVRAARLREVLDIPGQKYDSAIYFRDKLLMKQLAKQNHLKVPLFTELDSSISLLEFINLNGYPVVVKPRDGAGAEGVKIIKNNDDLTDFLSEGIPRNYMVEEFIDGQMFHIDVLTFKGDIIFNWPSTYLVSNLDFNDGGYAGSHLIEEGHVYFKELINYSTQLINSFPSPSHGAFHIEVFVNKEEEVILCEVASRAGGGKIVEQIYHAFDINLCEISVRSQSNLYSKQEVTMIRTSPKKMTGSLLIPPFNKHINRLPRTNPPENVLEYLTYINLDEQKKKADSLIDRIATFVVEAKDDMSIQDSMNIAYKWFINHLEVDEKQS
ncbi:ATP-grasp domain-containing protein [Alkalihalobacillus sp. 1P02AB]|uniref:ATP-grasp domain-containing protein n=1 Tax=Alkalihalobacillus sp. 1P02AB TaxID=3132260 RepID=UPI0039A50303